MVKLWMKPISLFLTWTIFIFTLPVKAPGQNGANNQTVNNNDHLAVAVLDLEGRGISTLEAQTLTDRMRSELVNTGVVTIVERSQMQEILDEQGFQQSGCTSDECAVEVGKLLGVKNMVTGSIGKIGSSYTLDVRMFEVQSGAIVKTVNKTYRGEVDGLITEIERLAWDLMGVTPPQGRFPDDGKPEVAAQTAIPKEEKKKSKTLLWVGLGVLVAGGVGAAVTLGGKEEPKPTIGTPPDFPPVP